MSHNGCKHGYLNCEECFWYKVSESIYYHNNDYYDNHFAKWRRIFMSEQEKPNNPKDLIGSKKVDLSLLPTAGLIEAARCMMNGAQKYGPFNWREQGKKVGYMTYLAADMRHLLSFLDGEDLAPDSLLPHLGHLVASTLVLMDAIACGNAVDDRPTKGPAPRLLNEYDRSIKQ